MWNMRADKLLFLFTLIAITGVGVQSDNSSSTEVPILRYARATNQQVKLSTPAECFRPCEDGKPLYCYYKFHLEYYTTMGPACNQCRTNSFERSKNQSTCECIYADGFEKTIFSINRQFPGPSIQVCQYDKIIVDVENAAEGTDTTIHWHGVFQNGYQYYDGVPHVTQCPISAPNTFRYQFSADNPGTHFYHSHSSLFLIDGQQGPLVVRQARRKEPQISLYDEDLFDHVIFLSDVMHTVSLNKYPGSYNTQPGQYPDNFVINGHGDWLNTTSRQRTNVPLAYFNVEHGKRYRFRMINSFGSVCPCAFTIQNHKMTVIATDGEDVQPITVDSITSTSGERYDFVLTANQNPESYWIQLRGLGECADVRVTQEAVLTYNRNVVFPRTRRPTFDSPLTANIELNSFDSSQCMNEKPGNRICINQLTYGKQTPKNEDRLYADKRFRISFSFFTYDEKIFQQNKYGPFYVAVDKNSTATMVSNISYSEPPSPLISQYEGYETLCTADVVPTCTKPCLCSHVLHVKKNELIEIVLCDEDPFVTLQHPFHLHGYSFQVMAIRDFGGRKPTQNEIQQFINDYDRGIKNNKYKRKPRKDTVKIPVGGCAILRFYTNNPGWWLFHCHFLWHTMSGMNMIIHVGDESDMPPVPNGFPVCGNYIPSVYI